METNLSPVGVNSSSESDDLSYSQGQLIRIASSEWIDDTQLFSYFSQVFHLMCMNALLYISVTISIIYTLLVKLSSNVLFYVN